MKIGYAIIWAVLSSVVLVQDTFGQAMLRNQARWENKEMVELLDELSKSETPFYLYGDPVHRYAKLCPLAVKLIESDRNGYHDALEFLAKNKEMAESLFQKSMESNTISNMYQAAAFSLYSNGYLHHAMSEDGQDDVALIRDLNKALPNFESNMSYAVFAEGQVLSQFSGSDEDASESLTSGSLGIQGMNEKKGFAAKISIAADNQVVSDNFGYTVLPRTGGKSLNTGSLDYIFHDAIWEGNLHLYGTFSTRKWSSINSVDEVITSDVVVGGFGALCSFTFVDKKVGETDLIATGEIGASGRILLGSDMTKRSNRELFLGVDKNAFGGIEAGIQLQLGDIVGAFQYYHYFGETIDGLTQGAVVAGFGINADLFTGL